MAYRIAVASTDGIVVNQHFGHAERFHIIELNAETGKYSFIEKIIADRLWEVDEWRYPTKN